ncbi:MAG TPA: ribonuclease H, partial [Phenylobacterium sp.]
PPQGEDAPTEDLDLWAALTAALTGRKTSFALAGPSKASPTGFAAAWAELARDKANAQGTFISAIPKPNLAKVAGL